MHLLILLLGGIICAPIAQAASPLKVIATVPELGSLAETVGGDQVRVTPLAKGTEDPHFIVPKPSFIKALSNADLLVLDGLDLEVGWLPVLLKNSRNARLQPGSPGYLDASTAITPLEVPTTTVSRSMGDVHPFGNPHYLQDPLQGLKVAALIRDRLNTLRPAQGAYFQQRYDAFANDMAKALVGPQLAEKYGSDGAVKLARLYRLHKLASFLDSQGDTEKLGGWLGQVSRYPPIKAVDDHNAWPYFANSFGIDIVGHLEPKPGIPPTTRHLKELIERMRQEHVTLILTTAYYDPRHARFVAEKTGATIVPMAHQVGSRPGTDDYLSMLDHNVRQLVAALSATGD